MPLVRLLILAIVIGLVLFLFRRIRDFKKRPGKTIRYDATVQCQHCGVHVPEAEAINKNGLNYCSEDHATAD